MGIERLRATEGQVTVELAVALPVALMVAIIALNALTFVSECAAFDRQARQSICTLGASPAYGQSSSTCAAHVQSELARQFDRDFEEVSVVSEGSSPGLVHYTATLSCTPTLLGRAFSGSVFSAYIPAFHHHVTLTLDPYKPGAVI